MIKAVVFDFFGVICSDQYWQYVKTDRQTESVYRDYADEVNLGEISWTDFVAKIADATHTSAEEVKEMYRSERIDPRMVNLISDLHESYKTGLITNAHHEFIDPLLEKSHLRKYLDSVVVSSRVGVVKPNPAIFEQCLEDLGVEPHEAVYFDDLDRHVASAAALGMYAIRFDNFNQAHKELQEILSKTS